MEVKPGFKQTEVGIIPEDWDVCNLASISSRVTDGDHLTPKRVQQGYYLLSARNVRDGHIDLSDVDYVGSVEYKRMRQRCAPEAGDLLISCSGSLGRVATVPDGIECVLVRSAALVKLDSKRANSLFIQYWLQGTHAQDQISISTSLAAQGNLFIGSIERLRCAVPPWSEQRAIATALSDVDGLLGGLDRLIAEKRDLKQAAMQQLLTGKTRLPGFHGEWEVKTLERWAECRDGVRVPLNEAERAQMKGDYPYCGANGVLDYVNGYVIDDDIILMAEDGGYFDEYETRPIAYRMKGKCWVNNHAHILKARLGCDQGFLYYSLVHKNILSFLASGTRAKLNKSEMNKIQIKGPADEAEQTAIAAVLSDMDAEHAALEARRDKTRDLKQAMMQELLTGRTRLVPVGAVHA